ncbi:MAG: TnsD family Tn7-like transposition protein [Candidatus Thiodiazotropha endolucinida]
MVKIDSINSPFQFPLPVPDQLGEWLPNETLFSWCSRYHRQTANGFAGVTRKQLFGHAKAGGAHDLPSGIDMFVARTGGHLGNAFEVIQQHTLLGFYLPFRPKERINEAVNRMCGLSSGSLKYQLGLLTSGLGAGHPLKACPICMELDESRYGVAYWHLVHQLPTVFVCPEHSSSLNFARIRRSSVGPCDWVLPRQRFPSRQSTSPKNTVDEPACRLTRLGAMSASMVSLGPSTLADAEGLGRVFRRALIQRGLASETGRIDWKGTLKAARYHFGLAIVGQEFDCLRSLLTESGIRYLLSGRSLSHPIRYMTMIEWLFSDWSQFLNTFCESDSGHAVLERAASQRCSALDSRKDEAIAALKANNESISAVARRLGVDYSTVASWALEAGKEPKRRPKKLKSCLMRLLIKRLQAGDNKKKVAAETGLSICTVNRIMRTVPGLAVQWKYAKFLKRRSRSRAHWLAVVNKLPGASICLIRALARADYAWLYRHDRPWLSESIAARKLKPEKGNYAPARMHNNDASLSHAVELAALKLTKEDPATHLQWEDLIKVIPALAKRQFDSHRYPLTLRVLKRILG